jgi:hypothetical protein
MVPGVLPSASTAWMLGRKLSQVGTSINPLTPDSEGIQVSSGGFGALPFFGPDRSRQTSFKQPHGGFQTSRQVSGRA